MNPSLYYSVVIVLSLVQSTLMAISKWKYRFASADISGVSEESEFAYFCLSAKI